ncbi:hypothetical protein ACSDQ9_01560 [Aestuariimicrobium soli]|uniref:hypothetical protein n=1 Tax=Aestuariimicrobium soli TaxID=2035834 RepID=UPI003EBF892D
MTAPQSSTPAALQPSLRQLIITVGTVAVALVVIGAISWTVLADVEFSAGRLALALGIVVATAAVGRIVGLRVEPLPANLRGDAATVEALRRVHRITLPAMALAEAGGLLCFALGFVLPMSRITVLVAMVVSAGATLWAALPMGSRLRSLVARLESEGGRTGLPTGGERSA